MLLTNAIKKISVLGILMALAASPTAFANSSIEINQDRSVGNIIQASSERTSGPASYSLKELMYDKGDRQSDQDFLNSGSDSISKHTTNFDIADLKRETGGGGGDHY
ncbi:hypothetical protein ACU6TU_13415 [Halomonas sp. LS-001]